MNMNNPLQKLASSKLPFNIRLHLKLRSKFILSFFLLVLIPFTAFGVVTYQRSEKIIQGNVFTPALKNITQISSDLDYYFKDIESMNNLLLMDRELISYFQKVIQLSNTASFSPFAQVLPPESSYTSISNLINMRGDKLCGVYFLDKNHVYFAHPVSLYYLTENTFLSQDWFNEALHNSGKACLFGTWRQFPGEEQPMYVISMAREFTGISTKDDPAVIRFDFDFNSLSSVIDNQAMDKFPGSKLYIVDSKGTTVYSKDSKELLTKNPYATAIQGEKSPASGYLTVNTRGSKECIVYYTSPYTSWKIISIIPLNEVLGDLIFIKNTVIMLAIVCLLLVLIFSFAVSSVLLKPLNQLTTAMAEIKNGNLSTRVRVRSHDETKMLADSFNSMAQNIEDLINKVYSAQLKQTEAELKALQNQINPHFLYNTLESIRGAALVHGLHSIAAMAKSLSMLFRYSISGKDLVTIGDELQHLENYIAIQNFRHENKFEVIYNIPEELHGCKILKLTLQPLIENSIKHGLEMKLGKGKIKITILEAEGLITVEISDDGISMPPEKLGELNRLLEEDISIQNEVQSGEAAPSGTGIGVRNVNLRIKLQFGRQYGLRFMESPSGTTVRLLFPAVH